MNRKQRGRDQKSMREGGTHLIRLEILVCAENKRSVVSTKRILWFCIWHFKLHRIEIIANKCNKKVNFGENAYEAQLQSQWHIIHMENVLERMNLIKMDDGIGSFHAMPWHLFIEQIFTQYINACKYVDECMHKCMCGACTLYTFRFQLMPKLHMQGNWSINSAILEIDLLTREDRNRDSDSKNVDKIHIVNRRNWTDGCYWSSETN